MADLDATQPQAAYVPDATASGGYEAEAVTAEQANVEVVADADDGAVAIVDVAGNEDAGIAGTSGGDAAEAVEAVGAVGAAGAEVTSAPAWPTPAPNLPDSEIHLAPGTMLADRYRLDKRIPTTLDNASAWEAVDRVLDRPVHCILLTSPNAHSGLDAARRAALVSDPHLAKVLDVGTAVQNGQSHHYVITEPLGGQTLAELVQEMPLDGPTARSIVGEVASALDAAERHGVHHVALRPDVVRIDDGRVLLSGLGLDADYAYPDGFVGDSATHDAVGLAALAYYAVSGYWPLATETNTGFRLHHNLLQQAPRGESGFVVPLKQLVPDVDPKIAALTERAFGSAGNMLKSPYQVVEALRPWEPLVSQGPTAQLPQNTTATAPVRHAVLNSVAPRVVRSAGQSNTGRIPRLGRRPVPAPEPIMPVAPPRPTVISHAPPVPVGPPPVVVTGRRNHGVIATPIVLGLALATVIGGGAWAANNVFSPFVAPVVDTPVPEPGAHAEPPTDEDGDPIPIVRPVIASATTVDPYGDGERPQNAQFAVDDDPSTYWYTYTYATPEFGGIKPGVGFWIELEELSTVQEVVLYANGSGGNVEIRQTTPEDPTGGELLASGRFDSRQILTFDPVEMDGVLLWITSLPQLPDGRYRLELRTINVQ